MKSGKGKVYLVGAGPGDLKLITIKALEAIQKADVVVYDRLANPMLLMNMKAGAERVYVGKLPDRHTMKQEDINQLLVDYALQGLVVTRLKGGDPSTFGRVGEEADLLVDNGIPYEIVPGITSVSAVPAYAGIPITHRDYASSFSVITGHEKPEKLETMINWDDLTHATGTLVILMGVSKIDLISQKLIQYGKSPDTPVALVRWGTRAEQATLVGTLSDISDKVKEADFKPPAVIVVGDVVKLREKLQWVERRPLFGKRILVTRSRTQASELVRQIEDLGGEAVEFPVIRIQPIEDKERLANLDAALQRLDQYEWVVFTSANGVDYFFRRLRELRLDIRLLHHARIAAVGPKTAEALLDRGLTSEQLPAHYQAEGLAELLLSMANSGDRIFIPRSSIARDYLPGVLGEAGMHVTAVDVYDNIVSDQYADWLADMLLQGDIHVITFASSSTVRYLLEILAKQGIERPVELVNQCDIICIGPITEATAKELGIQVSATAQESTIRSLVDALIEMN